MATQRTYLKDPDATLDYAFNWTDWLATGETISTSTVAVTTGITKVSDSQANGIVTVWLSGGTEGNTYSIANKITTSAGRVDERTIKVRIEDR
jgi:hypothetical protein